MRLFGVLARESKATIGTTIKVSWMMIVQRVVIAKIAAKCRVLVLVVVSQVADLLVEYFLLNHYFGHSQVCSACRGVSIR